MNNASVPELKPSLIKNKIGVCFACTATREPAP
jgi:hypothetical protein